MEYRGKVTVSGVNCTVFHLQVTTGMLISLVSNASSPKVLLCTEYGVRSKGISLPNLPGDRCLPFSFLCFFFSCFVPLFLDVDPFTCPIERVASNY